MIPFTQYLLPNGRKREGGFHRPPYVEALAQEVLATGAVFEAEVLRTGEVSLTCEKEDEEGDWEVVAIEVVSNGPNIPEVVDRLVRTAHERLVPV